jgi:Rod binding domain-containing protein
MNDYSLNTALLNQRSVPNIESGIDKVALKEKTDQFEAIIIKMLLDNAMKDEKDIFSAQKDPGDKIYKSMYRDELSQASTGSFGFSQMLFDHLSLKS